MGDVGSRGRVDLVLGEPSTTSFALRRAACRASRLCSRRSRRSSITITITITIITPKRRKRRRGLVDDHGELTRALAAVEDEPTAENVARFVAVLDAQLDREELQVVPVLLSVDPREAWDMIHQSG